MPVRNVNAEQLHVFRTAKLLAQNLADAFIASARDAIAAREKFSVALAGGDTPRAAYELLASDSYRSHVAWQHVHVYFGDERCVPPDDPASNYRMARETLLDAVPIPPSQIYRMHGEMPPQQAALEYARLLRNTLGDAPQLDLVMLGLGIDAHTASLFPGSDPTTDDEALCRAVYSESARMWRITLTPKVLNLGREVLFGVSGAKKASALRVAREGAYDPVHYPAQVVKPHSGRLLWYVDAAAAAQT